MDLNTLSAIMGVAVYLLCGIIALVIFDMATRGRLRHNFGRATTDAQIELAENAYTSTVLDRKVVRYILLFIIWIFWPFVFVGAIQKGKDVSDKKD